MKFARLVLPVTIGIFFLITSGGVLAQECTVTGCDVQNTAVEREEAPPPQLPGSDPNFNNVTSGNTFNNPTSGNSGATSKTSSAGPGTLPNPLGVDTFEEIAKIIGEAIQKLAIPIAAILIFYVGFQYMTSAGNPAKLEKANKSLLWILIGLAVIFIGRGFISLVQDILNLKNR